MTYVVRLRDLPFQEREQFLYLLSTVARSEDLKFNKGPLGTVVANWHVPPADAHQLTAKRGGAETKQDAFSDRFDGRFIDEDSGEIDYEGEYEEEEVDANKLEVNGFPSGVRGVLDGLESEQSESDMVYPVEDGEASPMLGILENLYGGVPPSRRFGASHLASLSASERTLLKHTTKATTMPRQDAMSRDRVDTQSRRAVTQATVPQQKRPDKSQHHPAKRVVSRTSSLASTISSGAAYSRGQSPAPADAHAQVMRVLSRIGVSEGGDSSHNNGGNLHNIGKQAVEPLARKPPGRKPHSELARQTTPTAANQRASQRADSADRGRPRVIQKVPPAASVYSTKKKRSNNINSSSAVPKQAQDDGHSVEKKKMRPTSTEEVSRTLRATNHPSRTGVVGRHLIVSQVGEDDVDIVDARDAIDESDEDEEFDDEAFLDVSKLTADSLLEEFDQLTVSRGRREVPRRAPPTIPNSSVGIAPEEALPSDYRLLRKDAPQPKRYVDAESTSSLGRRPEDERSGAFFTSNPSSSSRRAQSGDRSSRIGLLSAILPPMGKSATNEAVGAPTAGRVVSPPSSRRRPSPREHSPSPASRSTPRRGSGGAGLLSPSPMSKEAFLKIMLDRAPGGPNTRTGNDTTTHKPADASKQPSAVLRPQKRSPIWASKLAESIFTFLSKMIVHKPRFEALYQKELHRHEQRVAHTASSLSQPGSRLVDKHSKSLSGEARARQRDFHASMQSVNDPIPPPKILFADIIFKEVMRCHCGLDSIADQTILDLKAACHRYSNICPVNAIADYFLGCDDSDVLDQVLLFADTRQRGMRFTKQEVQRVRCQNGSAHLLERRYVPVKDVPPCVHKMVEGCADSVAARVKISVAEWVTEEMPFGGLAFDLPDHVDYVELTRAVVAERLGKWSSEAPGGEGSHHESLLAGEGNRAPLDNGYASIRNATAAQLAERMQSQNESEIHNKSSDTPQRGRSGANGEVTSPLSPAASAAAAALLAQAGRPELAELLEKKAKEQRRLASQHRHQPPNSVVHRDADFPESPVSESRLRRNGGFDFTATPLPGHLNEAPRVPTAVNGSMSPLRHNRNGERLRQTVGADAITLESSPPSALHHLIRAESPTSARTSPLRRFETSPYLKGDEKGGRSHQPKNDPRSKPHVNQNVPDPKPVTIHKSSSSPTRAANDAARLYRVSEDDQKALFQRLSEPRKKRLESEPTSQTTSPPRTDTRAPSVTRTHSPPTRRSVGHSPTKASLLRESCTQAKLDERAFFEEGATSRRLQGHSINLRTVPDNLRPKVSTSFSRERVRSEAYARDSPHGGRPSSRSPPQHRPSSPTQRGPRDPPVEVNFCPPTPSNDSTLIAKQQPEVTFLGAYKNSVGSSAPTTASRAQPTSSHLPVAGISSPSRHSSSPKPSRRNQEESSPTRMLDLDNDHQSQRPASPTVVAARSAHVAPAAESRRLREKESYTMELARQRDEEALKKLLRNSMSMQNLVAGRGPTNPSEPVDQTELLSNKRAVSHAASASPPRSVTFERDSFYVASDRQRADDVEALRNLIQGTRPPTRADVVGVAAGPTVDYAEFYSEKGYVRGSSGVQPKYIDAYGERNLDADGNPLINIDTTALDRLALSPSMR